MTDSPSGQQQAYRVLPAALHPHIFMSPDSDTEDEYSDEDEGLERKIESHLVSLGEPLVSQYLDVWARRHGTAPRVGLVPPAASRRRGVSRSGQDQPAGERRRPRRSSSSSRWSSDMAIQENPKQSWRGPKSMYGPEAGWTAAHEGSGASQSDEGASDDELVPRSRAPYR